MSGGKSIALAPSRTVAVSTVRSAALYLGGRISRAPEVIGATFDPRKLGFVSSLCAAKVPPDKIKEFVDVVNSYSGVTHNYERDNEYNIWFTFIDESMEDIENKLKEISKKSGIKDVRNLPTVRFFKIRVDFDMEK